ncbi:hypothetical protein [Cohnella luojiensis]|uniref:Alpha-L-rhamnosidase six-hairpin glycosidase domain-containing protein n=1 Tax=Cohnella luojiensis TaxID=652876 RepID=A0A4Y8M3T7_9BACL|nr:hypothetical protein [Cohnella luojiensis]TFE26901.1 hypothetical protein E2980_10405 [Cohnella luojiensis]
MTANEKLKMNQQVTFSSSEAVLDAGFQWAVAQALAYSHSGGDPVGLWYEAALPGRGAFCIRDVAHHSAGASVLGLSSHTKNMFIRFAENISASRDWCTYWEMTGDNLPASVDYTDDNDFWYNLPANFDLIDACYKQWLWTGDADYLRHPVLTQFYRHSCEDYVLTWDKDGDGIVEHLPEYGRRGIASYNEDGLQPLVGGDLLAAQFAGFRAYAELLALNGDSRGFASYSARAESFRLLYEKDWWNGESDRFYGALLQDRTYYERYYQEGNYLPLYFGIVREKTKLRSALSDVARNGAANVEAKTYMPDIFYRYGNNEDAYRELLELVDPKLDRREYPEVSFCVVGAIATGLMGLSADGDDGVATVSRLTNRLPFARLRFVPVLNRVIDVEHDGTTETRLTVRRGKSIKWTAAFPGTHSHLVLNGTPTATQIEIDAGGKMVSYLLVDVGEGQSHSVRVAGA